MPKTLRHPARALSAPNAPDLFSCITAVELHTDARQNFPPGHDSVAAISSFVTIRHTAGCMMQLVLNYNIEWAQKTEPATGRGDTEWGADLIVEPAALPVLAAAFAEAARQFEARQLAQFVSET